MYNMASKAGHTLDWEETTASKTKKKVARNLDYDSSDSDRFNETLSDWDIDIKESMAANAGKTFVSYTAPKKTKKQAQPDPEEYDDEYYEEEEDELHEVDDDGEEVQNPAVEVPSPEIKPKVNQAKQGNNLRPGPTKEKPQEPPADK
jgi:hypothetical protein